MNTNSNPNSITNLCIQHTEQIKALSENVGGLSEKVDRLHEEVKEANDKSFGLLESLVKNNMQQGNRANGFYIKVLTACFAAGTTCVLAAFGIKQIINIF